MPELKKAEIVALFVAARNEDGWVDSTQAPRGVLSGLKNMGYLKSMDRRIKTSLEVAVYQITPEGRQALASTARAMMGME